MVILSTVAAIIASQAVISGAFSVTRQAIRLGFLPRLVVRHTSREEVGQVYVPAVNWIIFAAVVALVRRLRLLRAARLGLRDRRHRHAGDRHAAVLLRRARALAPADVARDHRRHRVPDRRPDVLRRQPDEGRARRLVPARDRARRLQRADDLAARARDRHDAAGSRRRARCARSSRRCATPTRPSPARPAPPSSSTPTRRRRRSALRANVEHNHVLHECVLIVSLTTERVPYVRRGRAAVDRRPRLPRRRHHAHHRPLRLPGPARRARAAAPGRASAASRAIRSSTTRRYFVSRIQIVPTDRPGMARWRKQPVPGDLTQRRQPRRGLPPPRRAHRRHGLAHRTLN